MKLHPNLYTFYQSLIQQASFREVIDRLAQRTSLTPERLQARHIAVTQ